MRVSSFEYRMTGEMARDAALFCLDLLRCPEISNIIAQDRLLDVLYAFVTTSEPPASSSKKSESSMYFGSSRVGFAAEVMDSYRMRNELCPALMDLYYSCHAVAAWDANEDVQFDKFSVRVRISKLLMHLYQHPLPEPRQSILTYAAGNGFQAFLLSAIDTITFTTYESIRTINYDRRIPVGFAYPQAGEFKQRSISSLGHSKMTFDMMNLLFEGEEQIRAYLHDRPELLQRVALFLFTFFSRLFTVEVVTESVSTGGRYAEWGLKAASLVTPPVTFLMSCMRVSKAKQENLVSLIVSAPDFDLQVFERVSKLAEGAALAPFIDLSRYMIGNIRFVLLKVAIDTACMYMYDNLTLLYE